MLRSIVTVFCCSMLLVTVACKGDPNKPEYWEKAIGGAKGKKEKLRRVEELRDHKGLDETFLPMLHKRLAEEKSAEVRQNIAKILGDMKSPTSVEPLVNAIDVSSSDSDIKNMNKEVVTALGNIGDKSAASKLVPLLKMKGDNYTLIAAMDALGAMKADEASDVLIDLATNENVEPFISKKAIQALGDIGSTKAVPSLIKMMFKERRGVSFYVESSFALYQIGQPAGDALLPVLEEKDKDLLKWADEGKIMAAALPAKAAQTLGDLHESRAEKPLQKMLDFKSDMLDIKLFVRMRAADALGRLRSTSSVKQLGDMLDEEEATAREEYIRALIRIGGRDALPQLTKSASKGSWDAREPAMVGVAMLGDARELPAFEKFAKDEETQFTAECKADDEVKGCKDVPAGVKAHAERIAKHKKVLEAAKECEAKADCWAKKLADTEEEVRTRAAFEVGRSKNAALIGELLKRLTEANLETRLAVIMAADWLVSDSKEAAKAAQAALPDLEKQIASEKGKTEFQKVNEDLRRLPIKIRRS